VRRAYKTIEDKKAFVNVYGYHDTRIDTSPYG